MSETNGPVTTRTRERSTPSGSTLDAVKDEGEAVTQTAADGAGRVMDTAKQEAGDVVAEAKSQAKALYAQTQHELRQQAQERQRRLADGLRSAGDELRTMATSSQTHGLATDLVREASARVTSAGSWLADRDPSALVSEVKSFARRRPGVFIGVALLAGVIAGRLTRALAESAAEQNDSDAVSPARTTGTPALTATTVPPPAVHGANGMPGTPATGTAGAYAMGGTAAGSAGMGGTADDGIPAAPDGVAGASAEGSYGDAAAGTAAWSDADALREEAGDERRDSF